jgi:hypothetical protein
MNAGSQECPGSPALSPSDGEKEGPLGTEARGGGRGRPCPGRWSACPYGAGVCADWERRQAGLCLDCWAGVAWRASAAGEQGGDGAVVKPLSPTLSPSDGARGTFLFCVTPRAAAAGGLALGYEIETLRVSPGGQRRAAVGRPEKGVAGVGVSTN